MHTILRDLAGLFKVERLDAYSGEVSGSELGQDVESDIEVRNTRPPINERRKPFPGSKDEIANLKSLST